MKTHDVNDGRKTLLQWKKLGYVPQKNATGIELWANGNHQLKCTYYTEDEVQKMTIQEQQAFADQKRAKRREQQQKYLKQKEEEMEKIIYEQVQNNYRGNYRELCKSMVRFNDSIDVQTTENIVLDTETTGLNNTIDEILQVSIIDADTGKILYNELCKPFCHTEWKEAEAINHISPQNVAHKDYFAFSVPKIQRIISAAKTIIGYNVSFDVNFLKNYGIVFDKDLKYCDVMADFAVVYGDFSETYNTYKWQRLTTCAQYLNYDWGDDSAHDSLADCRATRYCYYELQKEKYQKKYESNLVLIH